MTTTAALTPGELFPSLILRSATNPRYAVDTAAGRYLLFALCHSGRRPGVQARLSALRDATGPINDTHAACFVLSSDPEDEAQARLTGRVPGLRVLWDDAGSGHRACGEPDGGSGRWILTDPRMRVIAVLPFRDDLGDVTEILARLAALPPVGVIGGQVLMAPILYLPDVFEPDLCRHLINLYNAEGGEESGFMREVDGKTTGLYDRSHKSRKDVTLTDEALQRGIQARIIRRVVPEIAKAHQFHVTRMERYIVACYAAEDGGHFSAHRDNTTAGTAHRRFAVSINLNDDFEGGEVSFPEYGPRGFKAQAGCAVVFSCSLLHAVSKVTAGRRYAFLPFLYDDAAADLRARNAHLLAGRPQPA